jgi:hypothetical protein
VQYYDAMSGRWNIRYKKEFPIEWKELENKW